MKLRTSLSLFISLIVISAIGLTTVSQAYAAQDPAEEGNKVVKFMKNLFNWPFGVTKKSSETVGRTTKQAVGTVTTTGSSAVETVTGKPEKIKGVVTEPVKGSAKSAYTAVEGTVKAPIEATKETFE